MLVYQASSLRPHTLVAEGLIHKQQRVDTYGRVKCLDLAVAGINDDRNTADRQRRLCDVGRYYYLARARRTLSLTYSRNPKSLSRFVREIHRPLLQWRGLPNFELSTLSAQIKPTSVQDWVAVLTGDDFRTIKQLQLLPPGFREPIVATSAEQKRPEESYCMPYWWSEQGMAAEFFDFLRAFWHRCIAEKRPESGGQWDRDAQRVIWTIKIAAEDAAFFEANRTLFEGLAEKFFGATPRGQPPPQIYYTEVIAAIADVSRFDQKDLIRIIQIIHKMRTVLYNMRFANVALSDFRFAAIRHSPPQESRIGLIEAWRTYTDGHPLADPIALQDLNAIYQVGLCRAIADGRSGVLTNLPGEREWARIRPFLVAFKQKALASAAAGSHVLSRVQVQAADGVVADVDMIVGTTAWFFVGGDKASELQRLDRLVTTLLTVHALRHEGNAGHRITHICLYQMITGQQMTWHVGDWVTASSILTAFVQARAQHTG